MDAQRQWEMESEYKRVHCPYFKAKYGKAIVCEGPLLDVNSGLQFCRQGDKREYMDSFCYTDKCWRGCVIAQAAAEKYEE